jgi:hypothetical protein
MKVFGSEGGSICTTRSTDGISSPREATSVVKRMAGVVDVVKRVKFF